MKKLLYIIITDLNSTVSFAELPLFKAKNKILVTEARLNI